MADAAKPKEGLPFILFLLALILGSVWNLAGGNLSAFSHVVESFTNADPRSDFGDKLERMIHIPPPLELPKPKILVPKPITDGEKMLAKTPQPLPPLMALGGEGKANPFFVKWAQELYKLAEEQLVKADPDDPDKPKIEKPVKPTPGQKYEEETYIFTGIVKIKDEPPVAVVRDVAKKVSHFLKEGDKFKDIQAIQVDLSGATFKVGTNKYTFDTLHSTTKTFTVRRLVKQ